MKNTLLHQVKSVHQTGGTPTPNLLAHDGSDDWLDRAFGKDAWRTLRRYLDFVDTTRVNRLRKEHVDLALVLHHARSIRNCPLIRPCAQRRSHEC